MASESNLFCDQGCSEIATAFGLEGTHKNKACLKHLIELKNKNLATYPISTYYFLQSPDDLKEYNRRKRLTDVGVGRVTVLEAKCEEGFQVGQTQLMEQEKTLQLIVSRCVREQEKLLELHYNALRHQLAGWKAELTHYLSHKEMELSTATYALCKEEPSEQCLSLKTLDCSVALANLVLESSSILSIGPSILRPQGDLLPELLPSTCSVEEAQEAVCVLFRSAQESCFSAYYETCLKELERGQSLLALHRLRCDSVNSLYAHTLAHFGQFDQAEEILKHYVSQSELEQAVLAFERGRWGDTVTLCERSLSEQVTEEGYFLLVHSYWYLGSAKADFHLQRCTESGSAIRTSLTAEQLKRQGRFDEAKRSFKEAVALCNQQNVFILCKATVLKSWGDLLEDCKLPAEAEHQYTQALKLFETHLPHSLQHAICRNNLAIVYDQLNLKAEAEAQFQSALQIYHSNYKDSKQYANCLQNLGDLYRFLDRKEEACDLLEEAKARYQALDLTEDVRACSISLNYLR